MKNQGKMIPSKIHNSQITELRDTEMTDITDKELKSTLFKMINDFKEDSNKQMMK
jgi:hypothetical protein